MKLRPCVYTRSLTAWRRADGEPALTEGALRAAFPPGHEVLEAAEEGGFGEHLEGRTVPATKPSRKR